jgi:hypothetical protein
MSRHPENKRRYNEATRKLKVQTKIKKRNISDIPSSLTATADTDYSFWKATRRLKQPTQHFPPIGKADETWTHSDKKRTLLQNT